MIRLSIKNELEKEEFEGVLYLEQKDNGEVSLKMSDDDSDDDWYILVIKPNGTFSRCRALRGNIGLQVNDNGEIIESEE